MLVTAQIALSMTLLVSAGLFIKSLVNVSGVDLGMQTENVVVFGLSPIQNGYETEESTDLFRRTEEALAAVPGLKVSLAEAIVADREAHGLFADLAELERVKGIGPKTRERLSPFLTVEP